MPPPKSSRSRPVRKAPAAKCGVTAVRVALRALLVMIYVGALVPVFIRMFFIIAVTEFAVRAFMVKTRAVTIRIIRRIPVSVTV